MANRSYLYAANHIPSRNTSNADNRLVGISEWNYDVPIAFKLLLSQGTQKCTSSIWTVPEEAAIAGDYELGVARLMAYLERINDPAVLPLKEEARQFLTAPENKRRYFVLECGELFDMIDSPWDVQTDLLLNEIRRVAEAEESARVNAPLPGFLGRLFGAKRSHAIPPVKVESLGLGNWSNILYFDPNPSESELL